MNDTRTYSMPNSKSFFSKFIVILLAIQLLDNILIASLAHLFIPKPNIPQYRLVSTVGTIAVLSVFLITQKPGIEELGLGWSNLKKSSRILYLTGGTLVLALVVSSYFIMYDRRYFALLTNLHFGITTPIFEELIFRGYGWENLRRENRSNVAAWIITSLVFGLFHLGYYFQIAYATSLHADAPSMSNVMITKVIYGTVLGLILGLLRWKSGRVYGPIILHAILNILGR